MIDNDTVVLVRYPARYSLDCQLDRIAKRLRGEGFDGSTWFPFGVREFQFLVNRGLSHQLVRAFEARPRVIGAWVLWDDAEHVDSDSQVRFIDAQTVARFLRHADEPLRFN